MAKERLPITLPELLERLPEAEWAELRVASQTARAEPMKAKLTEPLQRLGSGRVCGESNCRTTRSMRLRLLDSLREAGEMSVRELAEALEATQLEARGAAISAA